jgi:hypothetical protein
VKGEYSLLCTASNDVWEDSALLSKLAVYKHDNRDLPEAVPTSNAVSL